MTVSVLRPPLSFYTELLAESVPFSLSRWGDGEWLCVLGESGRNCDGHEYFPALGEDLRRILLADRPYMHAIGPLAVREHGARVQGWLDANRVERIWYHTDTFLEASVAGELLPLIEELRRRRVVYVGPGHLRGLSGRAFPLVEMVEVPARNCYLAKDAILATIRQVVEWAQPEVIGFSAGMTSNVLIDALFDELGADVTMIDFGSLWDVYCGVKSRSYARRPGWDELIARNIGSRVLKQEG